jgi:Skp family chaperone for outer membrane proteins
MLSFKRILLVFSLLLITTSISLSAEKIVFFDIDYVISKSKAGNKITKKLEKINKNNIKILNEEKKKLDKELSEIKKVQNVIEKKELQKKVKMHNSNLVEFNKKKKELSDNLKNAKKEEIIQLVNKINPILQEYMNVNSIDIILSKQGVYISKTNYDITQNILEIVNKKIN